MPKTDQLPPLRDRAVAQWQQIKATHHIIQEHQWIDEDGPVVGFRHKPWTCRFAVSKVTKHSDAAHVIREWLATIAAGRQVYLLAGDSRLDHDLLRDLDLIGPDTEATVRLMDLQKSFQRHHDLYNRPGLSTTLGNCGLTSDDDHRSVLHNATNDAVMTLRLALAWAALEDDAREALGRSLQIMDHNAISDIEVPGLSQMFADWTDEILQTNRDNRPLR